jgi:hypothetical protein
LASVKVTPETDPNKGHFEIVTWQVRHGHLCLLGLAHVPAGVRVQRLNENLKSPKILSQWGYMASSPNEGAAVKQQSKV